MTTKKTEALTTTSGKSLVLSTEIPQEVQQLDDIADACGLQQLDGGSFARALIMARGVEALRKALTPEVMQPIMSLQGSSLGFRTDKDRDGGYPLPAVRDCAIEATMRGARMVGNEWNILAGSSGVLCINTDGAEADM